MPGSLAEQSAAERLRRLYAEAEADLAARVDARLAAGIDQPGWTERKLLETQVMHRELEARVSELAAASLQETELALRQAYRAAAAEVDLKLGTWGVAPRTSSGALLALERSIQTGLTGTHFAIIRQHDDLYRKIVAEASQASAAGLATRDQVRRRMMDRFQERGVTGFVDKRGRHWTLRNYTDMASRTATAQAHLQGTADRLAAAGIRLGKVSNSPEECELCRPWEGRIIQMSGPREGDRPTLDDAKAAGLFHPRCTHSVGAYITGLTKSWEDAGAGASSEEEARQLREEARANADARARWGAHSTEDLYRLPDGSWTLERQKLHESILRDIMSGATPVRNPKAFMMGGGPASGKSVTLDSGVVKLPRNHVSVDPDGIKAMLPEYRASVEGGKTWAASFAHEESSYLSKLIAQRASQGRYNIVLDGTGDSGIDNLLRKAGSLRQGGQRVVAEYVTVDTEEAVRRSALRAARTGRVVPDSYIRGVHADVSDTFPKAINQGVFDEARLWDTDVPRGAAPKLVVEYKNGQLTIHDAAAWERFLAKSPHYKPAAMPTSTNHVAFIGDYEYAKLPDGSLARAPSYGPVHTDGYRHPMRWVTGPTGSEAALAEHLAQIEGISSAAARRRARELLGSAG